MLEILTLIIWPIICLLIYILAWKIHYPTVKVVNLLVLCFVAIIPIVNLIGFIVALVAILEKYADTDLF